MESCDTRSKAEKVRRVLGIRDRDDLSVAVIHDALYWSLPDDDRRIWDQFLKGLEVYEISIVLDMSWNRVDKTVEAIRALLGAKLR